MADIVKHTVSTDALDTLGTFISRVESRDAIHLAVEPIEAGQTLVPGGHVSINADGKAVRADLGKGVGIVDPFLTEGVQKGQWFWLVVYPRTITALHHVWEHPAFPAVDHKSTSEKWLRNFVAEQGFHSYDEDDDPDATFKQTIDAAVRSVDYGYMTLPFDANGAIPGEFWHHIEYYTGTKIPEENRSEYFSCAC